MIDFTALEQELSLDKMPQEQQAQIYSTILDTLTKRIVLRMANELTDEQKQRLETAGKEDTAMFEELDKAYPDFEKVYQEEIDKLKEDYKMMLS